MLIDQVNAYLERSLAYIKRAGDHPIKKTAEGWFLPLQEPLYWLRQGNLVIVKIQNVADFAAKTFPGTITIRETPTVIPPWSKVWFEFSQNGSQWACYFNTVVLPPEFRWKSYYAIVTGRLIRASVAPNNSPMVVSTIKYPVTKEGLFPDPGEEDDEKIRETDQLYRVLEFWSELIPTIDHQDLTFMFEVPLLAISFAHCNNVTLVKHSIDEKLRRRCVKRNKPYTERYHSLQIDSFKEMLRTQGQSEKVGVLRAMHICRGHFAKYGVDGRGLLFGKHAGKFFIPQTLKGSPKIGVVKKDYEIIAPKP